MGSSCLGSLAVSSDCINWDAIFGFEKYTCADLTYPSVRDPSIIKINGVYFVCHTAAIGLTCSGFLALTQSTDLVNWASTNKITLSNRYQHSTKYNISLDLLSRALDLRNA